MAKTFRFLFGVALLFVATPLILAACDGSATGDAESLLIDARIARQAGDIDRAISLLETAIAQFPESAPVRVELSSAYLDRDNVDLLDVDRVALFLTTFEENVGTTPATSVPRAGAACQYEDDPNAHLFNPRDYEEYVELYADRALIESVVDLLNGVDMSEMDLGLMPEELRTLSLCTGIENGELVYERESALASLRSTGLNDDEIATALAVNAVARFFEAYFFITEDIPQQTSWYRVMDRSGDYIGVCAEDPDALRTQVEDAIQDLGEAITSLDLRNHLLGGDTTSYELVQHVLESYEVIKDDLGPHCESNT